jgi:lipopolysaccharide transport system ATP-binding protein
VSQPIIRVENLSKAYRIGLKEEIPDTITSAITGLMRRPLEKFRKLRRLNTFGSNGHSNEEDLVWALKDVSFDVHEGEVVGNHRPQRRRQEYAA